jgi:hypothetical protein
LVRYVHSGCAIHLQSLSDPEILFCKPRMGAMLEVVTALNRNARRLEDIHIPLLVCGSCEGLLVVLRHWFVASGGIVCVSAVLLAGAATMPQAQHVDVPQHALPGCDPSDSQVIHGTADTKTDTQYSEELIRR